jgi:hypothetical protein
MYYTDIDPFTKQEVHVSRHLRDRRMQRALMQFFKAENWFTVREALMQAGRQDLIGGCCDCLIPAQPPKEAIEARRHSANQAARGEEVEGDHYHTVANPLRGETPGARPPEEGLPPAQEVTAAAAAEESRQVSHARAVEERAARACAN